MAHCLVCGRELGEPLAACARCATAYHRECLAYAGECAVFGCAPRPEAIRGKAPRVVFCVDDPARMVACWAAGGLGILGLASASLAVWPGALLLGVGVIAGCAAGRMQSFRVIDGKSRTIWRQRIGLGGEVVEPVVRFEECRALVLRRQFALDSAGQNSRWVLDLELVSGERLILGDGVSPDDARAAGDLLGLEVARG